MVLSRSQIAPSDGSAPRSRPRRRLVRLGLWLAGILLIAGLLFTDSAPLVKPASPPSADQVGAARAAVRQFRLGQERAGNTIVRFDNMELGAVGALASNGFRPHRLRVEARGATVEVVGSYDLPLGRWLNATVVTNGGGTGFPPVRLTVGSVAFPQFMSRWIVQTARFAAIVRGAKLPPLDRLVRKVSVKGGVVTATISLPPGSGLVSQIGGESARASSDEVLRAYCQLTKQQRAEPSAEFAIHVRRAFALEKNATAASNRAAFLALAMLTVDNRVGELAGLDRKAMAGCQLPPITTTLNDRADIPKHWALSAALAVATGTQFSQAMGEWKELADSISRQSQFAVGDPSGFSFIDLVADRSGFLTAELAVADASAATLAARLAVVDQRDLVPPSLMRLEEGMTNAEFVRKYGDIRDSRYLAAVARIDAELRRSAMVRTGPLAPLPTP